MPSACLADGAVHDVTAGQPTTGERSPKALCPSVVEAQQLDELNELVAVYVDTWTRDVASTHVLP
jgi:hypothetical protein